MGYKRHVVLIALLATAACRKDVEATVTQDAAGVTFATTADEGTTACIERAYVYRQTSGKPEQLWYATRGSAREPCVRQLRYTANPAGFSAASPPALAPGGTYRVELMGNGFGATKEFVRR